MTMKSNADCKKGLCHYDSASRTRFFNGMLLSDEHLRAEQLYHRDALKRMNRYIWGAGIVCGLKVEKVGGFCIKVHPGFALDCEGNAIEMCYCITIDLSDVCKDTYKDGCAPSGAGAITKCLVIRYKEIDDETVPVLTPDDDCSSSAGKSRSQPSRVREGFCLEFSDKCPSTKCDDSRDDVLGLFWTTYFAAKESGRYVAPDEDRCMLLTPECPECDCDCHEGICLAKLTIDCSQRDVRIEGDCRTYVLSPRLFRALAVRFGAQGRSAQAAVEKLELERIKEAFDEFQEQSSSAVTTRTKRTSQGSSTQRQPSSPAKGKGSPVDE